MDSASRVVQILRMAMLASIVLYVFVGEIVGHPGPTPNLMFFYSMTLAAVMMVVVLMVIRRLMIAPAIAALESQSAEAAAWNRWRGGYIVSYALCEAIALLGLTLRVLGYTLSQVVPFYAAGIILLLLFAPRRSSLR